MIKKFEIRKYNIRLTKDGLKAPLTKRSKRTLVTIKKFIEKNTRVKRGNIIIGNELNEKLWSRGIKNPPRKVTVFVQKIDDQKVFVNIENGKKYSKKEKVKKDDKKEEKNLEELTKEEDPKKEKKSNIKKE